MKAAEVVVLKGADRFRLIEQVRISPVPKLCAAADGLLRCLSVRRGAALLTDIDRASWVVEQRVEGLPLMQRLWVHPYGFSLGYRKSAPIGHPSELFFLDSTGRLIASRPLPDAVSAVDASPGVWHVGSRNSRVYGFGVEGKPLWKRRLKVPAEYSIPGMECLAEAPRLELSAGGGLVAVGGGCRFWVFDSFGHEQWDKEVPPEGGGEEVVCGPREVPSRERLLARLSLLGLDADRVHAGFLRLELQTAGTRPPEFLRTVEKYPWTTAEDGGLLGEWATEVVMAGVGSRTAIFSVGVGGGQIALGLLGGRVQTWDYEGRPQEGYRVGEGPVSVLTDHRGLHASYAGGLLTRFTDGQITGSVKLPPHHAAMALCGSEVVAWHGTDAWAVDPTGRVVWRASFRKKIGALVAHELGLEVLAGILFCFQRTPGDWRSGQATGEPSRAG